MFASLSGLFASLVVLACLFIYLLWADLGCCFVICCMVLGFSFLFGVARWFAACVDLIVVFVAEIDFFVGVLFVFCC